DREHAFIVSGTGDLIEPDDGLIGIGSGGPFALAAARALVGHSDLDAKAIVTEAMRIAAGICVYTNDHISVEVLCPGPLPPGRPRRPSPSPIATSSGRRGPSARWPSRCATAGAGRACPPSYATRWRRRTSS